MDSLNRDSECYLTVVLQQVLADGKFLALQFPLMPRPTTHSTRRLDSFSFVFFPYVHVVCFSLGAG
jgi:hypothetical protein